MILCKEIEDKKEKLILESIIEILSQTFDKDDFTIVSNTDDYLTLKYKNLDIARVKYTERSKWISVLLINKNMKQKYEESELFRAQKNKNQIQWKSSLENENIENYIEILKNACDDLNNN